MSIPEQLLKLLKNLKLCILATSYCDYPHLSLMNFTYVAEEGVIILSSRSNTTKVENIKRNPRVALLFKGLDEHDQLPLSCTIYGTANVVSKEEDLIYRNKHHKKNHDMSQFINGEHISVIKVNIESAALSDSNDKVKTWTNK